MSDFKLLDDDAGSQKPPASPPSQPSAQVPPSEPEEDLFETLPEPEPGFQFSLDAAPSAPTVGRKVGEPRTPQTPPAPPAGQAPQPQRPPGAAGQPQARPAGSLPVGPPTAGGVPRPAPQPLRPAPRPVVAAPTPAASPILQEEEAPAMESAPPEDDFSYKIWSFGQSCKKVLDMFEEPASWLLRVAVVIAVTSGAYLLAGILMGKPATNPNPSLVKYLVLASQAFTLSMLAGCIAAILVAYEDNKVGFGVGVIGGLFYFIIPGLLGKFIGIPRLATVIGGNFHHIGYFLVLIGIMKGFFDVCVYLYTLPEKIKQRSASVGTANRAEAKQRAIARSANMFSPCWQLPFCRESIRKACPAFLAKKTCWKFGRGCYCDEEMISRIVRGEAENSVSAPTRMSQKGKAPCGRCYIYLEHQTYKFRMLSPLALPVTVLSTWLVWPIYTKVFTMGNDAFNNLWMSMTFSQTKVTPDILKSTGDSLDTISKIGTSPEEVAHVAQTMFGVLLGFMLLIYISKAIEYAIFKAKL